MADIKTRETVKGTIKTLDKAAIAGQKMKRTFFERELDVAQNLRSLAVADADVLHLDNRRYVAAVWSGQGNDSLKIFFS